MFCSVLQNMDVKIMCNKFGIDTVFFCFVHQQNTNTKKLVFSSCIGQNLIK